MLFLLVGAILVFAMHGGFAFLEAGTVRHKNQVNALCKILVDFAISTVAYFFVGYTDRLRRRPSSSAPQGLSGSGGVEGFGPQGLTLVKFFFLCTFAAAVPAIISGGIAERARFLPQCVATALIVGLFYPFFEGIVWNKNYGLQEIFFKAQARRGVPRLRRLHRRARGRRLARLLGRAPARAAARPLRQGPHHRHSAVVDSVAGHGLLAAVHRLVRLQRDERADAADGHAASSP